VPNPDRQPHFRFYSGFLLNLVTEINLRLPRWDSSLSLKIQTLGALRYNKVCKTLAAQGICPLFWLPTGNHQSTPKDESRPHQQALRCLWCLIWTHIWVPCCLSLSAAQWGQDGSKGNQNQGRFFSGDPQYLKWDAKSSKIASLATGTVVDYKNWFFGSEMQGCYDTSSTDENAEKTVLVI